MKETLNNSSTPPEPLLEDALILIPEHERSRVLVEWNSTAVDYPKDKCLHELFEAQVERTPEALAVLFEDKQLTYRELNERANRVAHHLRSLGVGPDVFVGICMERAMELLVGLLGILKAGGAYVPFDPEYPQSRLAFMFGDADVPVLLTQARLAKGLPVGNAKVIKLDKDWSAIASESHLNPCNLAAAHHLAYMIYTSGSTGQPKGAMNTHVGIVNRLLWMQDAYGLTPKDRVLQKTPFSFDVSVWEFFWPLLTGAGLVLALPGGHKDSGYLAELIREQSITTLHFVPSMLSAFLEQEGLNTSCSSLKRVICSGEALSFELQQRFFSRIPCELHNLYGPTEASVDVTFWACRRKSEIHSVPIGRPIANTTIYILDGALQPVPVGVAGELHIGGVGLARGYHKRPELTAEKFIANPFDTTPGARLYKTGDLCRYRADGNIEYLGRMDQQVKIRGVRIELGEIETVLCSHPAVRECVVADRENAAGEKELAAYLVVRSEMNPTATELREFLLQKLPDYLVPPAFVKLEKLPLTPNGKLDRNALPAPDANRLESGIQFVPPRTPTELALAKIWNELLEVGEIGIHDNFFALGGHSLMAVRMNFCMRRQFNIELPLRLISKCPTIEQLSRAIDEAEKATAIQLPVRPKRMPRSAGAFTQKFPASFNQEQLWFIDQFEPGGSVYNVPLVFRLHGKLNLVALQKSLNHLIQRHESLRTTFQVEHGVLMQAVAAELDLKVQTTDLENILETGREAEAQRLMLEKAGRPFDLSHGPLMWADVFHLSSEYHVLLLTIHHIVFDGWSDDVMLKELAAGYTAYCNNHSPEMPDLPLQYADYAIWQRQYLTAEKVAKHLEYWRKELAGVLTELELPTDRSHSAIQHNRGAEQRFTLFVEMASALRKLGQQHDATLFMTLLAAFHVLLHRYSRQEQILVGVPFAGRTESEVENLIGFFVNSLPVKGDLSGNPTFEQLLQQVRDTVWAVQSHQDLPFERLVRELQPPRLKNRNPLFQVLAVLEVTPLEPRQLPGVTMELQEMTPPEAMFDLTLALTDRGNEVDFVLRYNADLFDDLTATRMFANYQRLLAGIVAKPHHRISEIPLVAETEHHQLLVEWNKTVVGFPQDRCIQELFEAQVRRTPEAVALQWSGGEMTYQELNRRSNQLAHHLRSLGTEPDSLVGIYLGRSPEVIISILGILKAGGAYVPLDPELPIDRIRFMIEDAKLVAVILDGDSSDGLMPEATRIVQLNRQASLIAARSELNPNVLNAREHLAYVLYTSGSTGRPKGVLMPHGALINLIQWQMRHSSCSGDHRTLQFAPVGFDVCFQEIFSTLASGGSLFIPTREERKDFTQLIQLIDRMKVNRLFLPFVALDNLAGFMVESGLMPKVLHEIITAGEQLRVTSAIRKLFQSLEGARLVNQYGPTEAHVVSAFELNPTTDDWPILPPIGRPIANVRLYIVDGLLQPVPVGVAGELIIGGISVARGYLNRPELTAEKFIADPFSSEPGARLYKTGDLARYLSDGNIEYLGRIDQQVKIRGFRIEPGEIEAVLTTHPQIISVAVMAREEVSGEKNLVAYMVLRGGIAPTVTELREFLAKQLPDYMIPSAYVNLKKMPLSPNGKIDRKALPAPGENKIHSGADFVAPRTATETVLAKIWSELLGVERVGIHDNFFALGGHSLMAVRMGFRIRKEFNIELPLKLISEFPTVARLGLELDKTAGPAHGRDLHRIERSDKTAGSSSCTFPVSCGQEQLWLVDQLEPGSSAYNLPMILRVDGRLDRHALQRSLDHLIGRHEALRAIFSNDNGVPVQAVVPMPSVDLPVVNLEHIPMDAREAEASRLMIEAASRPFELSRGPLVRAELFSLGPEKHALLLVVHHIVWDGWSVEVLLREFAAGYAAFCEGHPPELPELPVQYVDYAVWQRQYLTTERVAGHLGYWREQFTGVPIMLELPTDRPHAAVRHHRGAEHRFKLSSETTMALRQLGQQQEGTLFMTVLAVFHVLLHRYSGQQQTLVGVPFAGRNSSELEPLIGFFVNALPVKGDCTGNPRFVELLRQVRDTVWSVQAHQDLPFERLVRELQPVREANRNPLFQVCLVFEVLPEEPCRMPGLKVELNKLEPSEVMFDLTLSVSDRGDELDCAIRYKADLFDAATVARLVGSYEKLIAGILASPQERVSAMPLIPETERQQLLLEWNRTETEYPRSRCVHQLFEDQAEHAPDAEALVFEEERLSYRELNERANQLAHRLRALGVMAGSPVGVHVDRSIEYVICVLGILKSGGAYMPLDTAYPPQRIQFMLADAAVKVVITDQTLPKDMPLEGIVVLDLAQEAQVIRSSSTQNLENVNSAEHPAYVIYTSGSTGQPKGVVVPHHGVTRLVRGQRYAEFNDCQRFLLLASTSFDATTFELWGPLLNGGACVIFPKQLQSLEQLAAVIRQQRITCLWLTAGLFNQIIDTLPSVLETVGHVLTGGEALSVSHVRKAMELLPSLRLTNGYGPTESTTFACCYAVSEDDTFINGSVPIGRPIGNTRCHVLDMHRQPVPVGVAGELYIGGDGLALGYLNRPELTAEKFIADPFSDEPGARLYRTGDLCRYRADGNIEFLGRLDNQVKIRGFRIELGEIEAVLAGHPNLQNAAVVAREDEPGSKYLAAYLVAGKAPMPTAAELRGFLLKSLPDYMVPAAFVTLEKLPLNPNGKVDRRALPAPDENRLGSGTEFAAPQTETEVALAKIWCELLDVERIGIHDNFFAVGGHSLMAVRMVYEIKRQMKFDLPVRTLFQRPTIQALVEVLQAERVAERKPELIQLQAGKSGPELYFLIDEGSLGLFKLSHFLGKDQTVYASVVPQSEFVLKASAKKQYAALPRMEHLAAEHVALIKSRQPTGPVLVAGHCFGGLLAFEVAQQLQAAGIQIGAVLLLDTWMARTTFWWEKKAWLREHLGKLVQQGPLYLWRKSSRRIKLEKAELDSKFSFFVNDDFHVHVPKAIIFRIYRQAMKGYQPKALASRGILFISQDDWLSNAYRPLDDSLGTGKYFTGGVEVVNVPGNHVTVLNEEHLPELARHFDKCLQQFR